MTDPRRERDGGRLTTPESPQEQGRRQHASNTDGTDRDFDESGESINQGHGHPREQRRGGEPGGERGGQRGDHPG
jgi:hypothetical protein